MSSSLRALLTERTRSLQATVNRLRQALPAQFVTRLWRALRVAAIALAIVGVYVAWIEFPRDLHIMPAFALLAGLAFAVGFAMHTFAWHSLTQIFFPQVGLLQNAEAVAGSNLVKYLPTVVWYIANRSHYYHQYGVPPRLVVVASLTELVIMALWAALLLLSWWVGYLFGLPLAALLLVGTLLLLITLSVRWGMLGKLNHWAAAIFWYGSSWLIGILILWLSMRTFVPLTTPALIDLAQIWLLTGLTSYLLNLTLGAIGIARELTLTVLLSQQWPLAVAIAVSIIIKLVLTLGELLCSLIVLGSLRLWRQRSAQLDLRMNDQTNLPPKDEDER
jgi:hypothetical protein